MVLAFGIESETPYALDVLCDTLFIVDVLLQFFHGYVVRGYPVLELQPVARRCAQPQPPHAPPAPRLAPPCRSRRSEALRTPSRPPRP